MKDKQDAVRPRWARNVNLARYLGVTTMAIWRWQRDPEINFPAPCRLGSRMEVTDLDEVDRWLRARAVIHAAVDRRREPARTGASLPREAAWPPKIKMGQRKWLSGDPHDGRARPAAEKITATANHEETTSCLSSSKPLSKPR